MTLIVAAIVLLLASLSVGWTLTALARRVAPRCGLIDRPGGRKAHQAPTPLGGGVAIWATVALVLLVGALVAEFLPGLLPADLRQHLGGVRARAGSLALIFGLATAVMAMGLLDDRFGLSWWLRLGIQVVLAAILVLCGVQVTLFWPLHSAWVTVPLTVLWVVGLTNSFNFLDNMDGLAGGVGLIVATLFALAQCEVGGLFVPAVLLILIGALGGFLMWNRPPARIFMGDAGSNFLGFLLGALTVVGTFTHPEQGDSRLAVLTPLVVMAVPLYDTISVILIRLREGRSPFQADRSHFSHRLVDRGLTPPQAVRTIYLVTLAAGLGTLLLPSLGPSGAGIVLAQAGCILGVIALLEWSPERRGRSASDGEARQPRESDPAPRSSPRADDPLGAVTAGTGVGPDRSRG